jgi:hypothetical protein
MRIGVILGCLLILAACTLLWEGYSDLKADIARLETENATQRAALAAQMAALEVRVRGIPEPTPPPEMLLEP